MGLAPSCQESEGKQPLHLLAVTRTRFHWARQKGKGAKEGGRVGYWRVSVPYKYDIQGLRGGRIWGNAEIEQQTFDPLKSRSFTIALRV